MTTYALVHGAWHGAWCWERLTPLLQQAGHDVVTMDLPSEDGAATFDSYADVVCAALTGCDDDVVLVGHSYGGNTVPLVAARRPIRHLVYLCAMIPDIGRSLFDQLSDEPEMLNPAYEQGLSVPDEQLRQVWADLDIACAMFYGDCDEPTTKAALDRLRPQSAYPAIQPFSLTEFPGVKTTYVVCAEDQILRPEWSRQTARERIGAELIELPGDHSPFYSRPSVLADVLLGLAN
jgi:pimeloyl-ACP methyl ester carboxylesterase